MKKLILCALAVATLAPMSAALAEDYGGIEKVKAFIGRQDVANSVQEIEARGWRSQKLPDEQQPWSSTYWPSNFGEAAYPYAWGGSKPILPLIWEFKRGYFNKRITWLRANYSKFTQAELDTLAPSEKYDLLVGDENFTLTAQTIAKINQLHGLYNGWVPAWFGVCHGWAPASLSIPRPQHSFTVQTPFGQTIKFFPDDVKALASTLWAHSFAQNQIKVDGWQCSRDFTIKMDNRGRLLEPKCFDVNPAFFHLVITNQLGLNQRGIIVDREYMRSVQNQPVASYSFKYMHPGTKWEVGSMDAAMVPVGSFDDPFIQYRSPKTKFIVGISMTVDYGTYTSPEAIDKDDKSRDKVKKFEIGYDLELDGEGQIVGGEWRDVSGDWYSSEDSNRKYREMNLVHPDIMWLVPNGLQAWSVSDADLQNTNWTGVGPVPAGWKEAAIKAAMVTNNQDVNGKPTTKLHPQPLGRVVYKLVELSRQ